MFLVFDGSKAVGANRRATANATIDAKVAGAPASRINMKTQQPISSANKIGKGLQSSPAPAPKKTRKSKAAGAPSAKKRPKSIGAKYDKKAARTPQ